ncbi:dihydrodipicolinate reductase [Mycobacterium pyrenivorans]|nr:dihydrodipicolinate reductase [Mycolicibacterium pyrenivorans]
MTGTTRPRLRVVHAGTGLTGREALGAIIDDPALELVGVAVTTPQKVGVDAGSLCGRDDVGVTATDDVDAVIALRPDCVCYCATAVRREEHAVEDIARYLRSGIDVVTISTIPLIYPPAAPQEWLDTIGSAADQGGATFYATGGEPGFISLNVPTALLAGAGRVDAYRMDLYAIQLDAQYPIWDVLHESMGFGKADGYVPARIAYGKVEADWSTVVRYVADILGLTLDGLEVDWETVLTPTDLDTAIGVVPAGTICAHRWRLAGTIDKQPIVAVQYFAAVSSAPWPSHWPDPGRLTGGMSFHISGRPGFRVDFEFDKAEIGDTVNPGVTATAMAVVNAIPAVVAAAPGIIELPLSGPSIVTRRATPRPAPATTRKQELHHG